MTAGSLAQAEELIEDALLDHPDLVFESIYTMDRVAYDDRPQSLSHIPPTRRRAAVHEITIEPWNAGPGNGGTTGDGRATPPSPPSPPSGRRPDDASEGSAGDN